MSPDSTVSKGSAVKPAAAGLAPPGDGGRQPATIRYLDRADAILLPVSAAPALGPQTWPGVSPRLIEGIPTFNIAPPTYSSPAFLTFAAQTLQSREAQFSRTIISIQMR